MSNIHFPVVLLKFRNSSELGLPCISFFGFVKRFWAVTLALLSIELQGNHRLSTWPISKYFVRTRITSSIWFNIFIEEDRISQSLFGGDTLKIEVFIACSLRTYIIPYSTNVILNLELTSHVGYNIFSLKTNYIDI